VTCIDVTFGEGAADQLLLLLHCLQESVSSVTGTSSYCAALSCPQSCCKLNRHKSSSARKCWKLNRQRNSVAGQQPVSRPAQSSPPRGALQAAHVATVEQ